MTSLRFMLPIVIAALTSANWVEARQAVVWDQVTAEASPAKPEFVLAEPVTLVVRLRNNGDVPTVIHTANLGVAYETTQVQITSPGGQVTEYRLWSVREPGAPSFGLAPGASSSFSERLHWNAATDALAFPAPGTYRVLVRVFNLTGAADIVSNAVDVVIVEPRSEGDRQIADLISTRHIAGVLNGAAEPSAETVAVLDALASDYTSSVFTPYVRFALGVYYGRNFLQRKADDAAAARQFQQAIDATTEDHPLRISLLGMNMRNAVRDGEIERARDLLERASAIREDSLELMPMRNRLRPR